MLITISKVKGSNLANGETKLSRPDHHLHLEDVALADGYADQVLQHLFAEQSEEVGNLKIYILVFNTLKIH